MEEMEITEELRKELGIESIEDYRRIIMDDKKTTNKQKHKKMAKINTKVNKKRQKLLELERSKKVIASLVEHNKLTKGLELKSIRDIGVKVKLNKKRPRSVEEEEESESVDEEEQEIEESLDESSDSIVSLKERVESEPVELEALFDRLREINNIKAREEIRKEVEADLNDADFPIPTQRLSFNRLATIEETRKTLPVSQYETELVEVVNKNLVTIISSPTGSGKSTQIPQFLLEYGYGSEGMIGVTQPRRVAASSLAARVSEEMNVKLGFEVGYQIKFDNTTNESTKIKFMTDGILLKQMESDKLLTAYSVLIIDEAHERSINSDVIIGLLASIVKYRYVLYKNGTVICGLPVLPLRVLIMSATLQVETFMNPSIFSPIPKLMMIEGRMFPVTIHHTKQTNLNYYEEALKTVVKLHKTEQKGDMLVFLTGKKEIKQFCQELTEHFESCEKGCIVLPLFASLPKEELRKVFETYEERKIVVSTNVAETSLTIPGIKFVIDTGRQKSRVLS